MAALPSQNTRKAHNEDNTMHATLPARDADVAGDRAVRSVTGDSPEVFAEIYRDNCNMAVWQRQLPAALQQQADALLRGHSNLQAALSLSPQSARKRIVEALGSTVAAPALADDIAELVDMFCYLFGVHRVGLRLTALAQAMCPRFHVDHVPCRLITTYTGPATQWLPHERVQRSKLGNGNGGKPDESSGLFRGKSDIQEAGVGDVLLLKGERWEGNEGAGLVHRSPSIADGGKRLLLTLDLL